MNPRPPGPQPDALPTELHSPRSLSLGARRPLWIGLRARLARQKGFEPLTHGLEGRCSFHLSYWRESGRADLNGRPPAPKAGALPGCATPRTISINIAPPLSPYFSPQTACGTSPHLEIKRGSQPYVGRMRGRNRDTINRAKDEEPPAIRTLTR